MTASRIVLALAFSLTLAAPSIAAGGGDSIGNGFLAPFANRVGNGSPMIFGTGTGNPKQAELGGKCLLHWTKACDKAFGIKSDRAPLRPAGEGLPLPWPFPW